MLVDFVIADHPLVMSAYKLVKKALERAGSAVRQVGHSDDAIATDLHHLEAFEARYSRARVKANGEGENGETPNRGFNASLEVPPIEAAVIRTGVLMLLQRHTSTADTLQEEIDLQDKELSARLGDMRNLGLRLGGQADLFSSTAAQEKRAMAAEMGMSGAALGAPPPTKLRTGKGKRKTQPPAAGRKADKRKR